MSGAIEGAGGPRELTTSRCLRRPTASQDIGVVRTSACPRFWLQGFGGLATLHAKPG